MKQFGLKFWTVLSLSCAIAAAAVADEPPAIKPGMWEIRTQHAADGKAAEPTTLKQCKEASEIAKGRTTAAEYAKKNCSKNETHQSGGQWVTDMVCTVGARVMTSHTVTSMTGDTGYHTDTTATFDPPAPGRSRTSTIVDGKWLGTCSPD